MKTISKELKAKVFAQYWGQKVLYVGGVGLVEIGYGGWNLKHPDFYLELKSLSNISNEDAIECLKIAYKCVFGYADGIEKCDVLTEEGTFGAICFNKEFNNERVSITVGKSVEFWVDGKELIINQLHVYQYLQSKGYAMPCLDYSVEDLVELGVYKLK